MSEDGATGSISTAYFGEEKEIRWRGCRECEDALGYGIN